MARWKKISIRTITVRSFRCRAANCPLIRFPTFDQNFVKQGLYKETGTGNVNDSRSVAYHSNENRILISEEIVGSHDQAESILRY